MEACRPGASRGGTKVNCVDVEGQRIVFQIDAMRTRAANLLLC
jgi:hypothetical protein